MKTISDLEASVLTSIATHPHGYSVSELDEILPGASEDTRDIAIALMNGTESLRGKAPDYLKEIESVADALRSWVASMRAEKGCERDGYARMASRA